MSWCRLSGVDKEPAVNVKDVKKCMVAQRPNEREMNAVSYSNAYDLDFVRCTCITISLKTLTTQCKTIYTLCLKTLRRNKVREMQSFYCR